LIKKQLGLNFLIFRSPALQQLARLRFYFCELLALWCGAACLIRLAASFATGDGGKVAEQVAGFEASSNRIGTAVGSDVELFAVVDD
jgi:hypothetical protein